MKLLASWQALAFAFFAGLAERIVALP